MIRTFLYASDKKNNLFFKFDKMMTMVEGTSIDLGDPMPQDIEQIEIETPEERLLFFLL